MTQIQQYEDAYTDVRALREQMMPAFATEMVCCSIASCRMARVESEYTYIVV